MRVAVPSYLQAIGQPPPPPLAPSGSSPPERAASSDRAVLGGPGSSSSRSPLQSSPGDDDPNRRPEIVDADVTLPPLRRRVGSTLPFARDQDVPDVVRAAWADEKAKRDETVDEVPPKSGGDGDETAFLPRRAFDTPGTPFEKNDVQARPASSRSFKTEALDLASLQRPLTPFNSPSLGATPAPPAATPAPRGATTSEEDGDQTPFIPAYRLAEAIGTPASSPAPGDSPASSELDITQPPLRLAAAAAMPFRALDPAEPLDVGIERYAVVSAALAGDEPQEQVLARFGLTRDDWIAEMRRMSERFSAEPRLRAQYQELVRRALGRAV